MENMKNLNVEAVRSGWGKSLAYFLFIALLFFLLFDMISAVPQGPTSIAQIANSTKAGSGGTMLNTSGGVISVINLNATTQNMRWKAFVGNVTGKLALDDAGGSTIYDWTLSSVTGEVYATRNLTTPIWANVSCANLSMIENENFILNHTNPDDNLSKTFNYTGGTHAGLAVGSVPISANTCPTLNTYKSNYSQDVDFEEIIITDSTNFTLGGTIIFTTIIEQDVRGYNNISYDFQMIVPERGESTWTGSTAYYLYVELT